MSLLVQRLISNGIPKSRAALSLTIVSSVLSTSASWADIARFPIRNNRDDLSITRIGLEYSDVRLRDLAQDDRTELRGAPALPLDVKIALLPPDAVVRGVSIVRTSVLEIPGETRPYPIGEGPRGDREEDPEYYERAGAYPDQEAWAISTEDNGGFHLLRVAVMPVSFHPAANAITLTAEMEVVIEYDRLPDVRVSARRTDAILAADPILRRWVAESVENPSQLDEWYPKPQVTQPSDSDGPRDRGHASRFLQPRPSEWPSPNSPFVELVIVTSNELLQGADVGDPLGEMTRYADWRDTWLQSETEVRLLKDIRQNYPAEDPARSIQMFFEDAYANWGTRYFILGGDVSLVPTRFTGKDHPCAAPPAM